MQKENLILVNSFGTNSIILHGLIDYLDKFFNVYFINLPGFITTERRLEKITFSNYSKFLENKIKSLELDHFIIGGISFGFLIVNNTPLSNNCKGIIAIEPYINSKSLAFKKLKIILLIIAIKIISILRLQNLIWKSRLFKICLKKLKVASNMISLMLAEVDPIAFFKTAELILINKDKINFSSKPYVLLMNKHDETVSYNYLTSIFTKLAKQLLIIEAKFEHYPSTITKQYFEKMVPESQIRRIYNFLLINSP